MAELLTLLVVLGLVIGILVFAIGGRGVFRFRSGSDGSPTQFSLRRAGVGRSLDGYLLTQLLATMATVQLILELAPRLGDRAVPYLVGFLVLSQVGLVLWARVALWTLSVIGVVSSGFLMVLDQGPATAVVVLLISVMAIWVGGAVRGFAGQRP